jgi:hypothetical protein
MISLLASGVIRTEPLTAGRYPLADVAAAFDTPGPAGVHRPIVTM